MEWEKGMKNRGGWQKKKGRMRGGVGEEGEGRAEEKGAG